MAIISRPASKEFRNEYDRVFGKKEKKKPCEHPVYKMKCKVCGADCGESENAEYAPWLEKDEV